MNPTIFKPSPELVFKLSLLFAHPHVRQVVWITTRAPASLLLYGYPGGPLPTQLPAEQKERMGRLLADYYDRILESGVQLVEAGPVWFALHANGGMELRCETPFHTERLAKLHLRWKP